MKKNLFFCLFATLPLLAGSEADVYRQQIQMQQQQIEALQKRVDTLAMQSAETPNKSASFSQTAYLPDIALILNMSALSRDIDNSTYKGFAVPGFIDAGEAKLPFNKNRGFNLNYAEVAMHSSVDPYFDAFAIFHLHPDEFEIGEAYVQTTSLPYAFRIKAGKFRSAFGRINEKHQHAWHFDNQPLVYKAMFGPDGIGDPGIQLQWVAPTDTYLMIGAEAMQGTNARSFGDAEANNLYIGYLKSSVDLTDALSVLGGVSLAHGKNDTTHGTDLYGLDLTLRQQLGSYSALIWQSEYLHRKKDLGTRTDTQAGYYSELVYQYNNNYSAGIRYDAIAKNDTDLSAYAGVDTGDLHSITTMVEYKPFPMSRLRLSWIHDRSKVIDGRRRGDDTVMLTLNIAAGAHGAHNY